METVSAGEGGSGNSEAPNVPLTWPHPPSQGPCLYPQGPYASCLCALDVGPDHSLLGGRPVCIPGLYPLDASSTLPSCDNPKYPQTLPTVPWGVTWPLL